MRAAKPRTLLAFLLLHRNEAVASERLIDWLWDGSPPTTARTSLHVYISDLRKLLGDGRVDTTPAGYVLHVDDGELDVDLVEQLLEEASDTDPRVACTLLRRALECFRGDPLPELRYHREVQQEIARLEELRLRVLERWIDARLDLGDHEDLVPELEGLVATHPYREGLRIRQMLALYRSGRQVDALAVFHRARTVLRDEFGLEPSLALRELQQQILEQDPALEPHTRVASRLRAPSRRRRSALAAVAVALAAAVAAAITVFAGSGARHSVRSLGEQIDPADLITQSSIAGVSLGHSSAFYELQLGGWRAQVLSEHSFPSLEFQQPEIAVYFPKSGKRGAIVSTWNQAYRTAAGIGPCSTLAAMRRAYGSRVHVAWAGSRPSPHAFAVGNNLLFSSDDLRTISSVALYHGDPRNTHDGSPQAYAAYVTAVETACE